MMRVHSIRIEIPKERKSRSDEISSLSSRMIPMMRIPMKKRAYSEDSEQESEEDNDDDDDESDDSDLVSEDKVIIIPKKAWKIKVW